VAGKLACNPTEFFHAREFPSFKPSGVRGEFPPARAILLFFLVLSFALVHVGASASPVASNSPTIFYVTKPNRKSPMGWVLDLG